MKPLGSMRAPAAARSGCGCAARGKLFINEQGVVFPFSLFLPDVWNFEEDGNVILRAIFKFSGIDLQY